MNLELFIQKVDTLIEEYSPEDLKLIIHKLALQSKSVDHDKFLDILQSNKQAETISEKEYAALKEQEESINEFVDRIRDGHRFMDYRDYSIDGHEGYCLKFYIHNEFYQGLSDCSKLVHNYVKLGKYNDANSLATKLLSSKVVTEMADEKPNNYDGDGKFAFLLGQLNKDNTETLDLELILKDVKQLAIDAILSAYFIYDEDTRLRKIFDLFRLAPKGLDFEDIIRAHGMELDGFQDFLKDWIQFIVKQNRSTVVSFLLGDAIFLLKDEVQKITRVLDYCAYYPELLYNCYLQVYPNDLNKRIDFVYDNINILSSKLILRSKIALRAATDLQSNKINYKKLEMYREFLLIAFESHPSVKNYFRFLFNYNGGQDRSRINSALCLVLSGKQDIKRGISDNDYEFWRSYITSNDVKSEKDFDDNFFDNVLDLDGEFPINWLARQVPKYEVENYSLTKRDKMVLSFFDGRFIETVKFATNSKDLTKISNNYPAISLMLLYLYNGQTLEQGCDKLLSDVIEICQFNDDDYTVGFEGIANDSKSKREFFYECFKQWKKLQKSRNQDLFNYCNTIVKFLAAHYSALVKSTERVGYAECAKYVVAAGEVVESRGIKGDKLEFLKNFIAALPKNDLFLDSLKSLCPEFIE